MRRKGSINKRRRTIVDTVRKCDGVFAAPAETRGSDGQLITFLFAKLTIE